jgi:hypothetical protein
VAKARVNRSHVNHLKKRQTSAFEHGAVTGAVGTTATLAAAGAALHKHLQHHSLHFKVGTHNRDGGGYEAHLYSTKNVSNVMHSPAVNTMAKVGRDASGRFVKQAIKRI